VPGGTPNRLLYALVPATTPPVPPPGPSPAAPTLVAPANGSGNVSRTPALSWNAAPGTATYRLQVSTSASFATTNFDRSGIAATSQVLPTLASRTVYYWRVNASNANGTSAFSATWSFRTRKN